MPSVNKPSSVFNLPMLYAISAPLRAWIRRMRTQWPHRHTRIDSSLIGAGVKLGENVWVAEDACIGSASTIGDCSYLNSQAVVGYAMIGKFSSIGYGAMIGTHEHPTHLLATSPFLYGPRNILGNPPAFNDLSSPAVIGNDVWIGAHAVVRLGIKVGDGAIVGAGAIVTHDVPPYAIVAGVPARVLRYRAGAETIAYLLEWKWWDLTVGGLAAAKQIFATEHWEELLRSKNPRGSFRNQSPSNAEDLETPGRSDA